MRRILFAITTMLFYSSLLVVTRCSFAEEPATANRPGQGATPVRVLMEIPKTIGEDKLVSLVDQQGTSHLGQVTAPGLSMASDDSSKRLREVCFLSPRTGAPFEIRAVEKVSEKPEDGFCWKKSGDDSKDLALGDKPVLRYMFPTFDQTSPETKVLTYKPFHHVFNPAGTAIITKGPGGLYTHHRGLFYGFNKVTYGDGKATDVWHCTKNAHQAHEEFINEEAGPILGRHCVAIDWHGQDGEAFAKEQREMTVYNLPGGTMIDFVSRLASAGEKVHLDGDPQHAGFHFRASQEVADKTKGDTYYLRTDGKGKLGETRNWNPKNRKDPINGECENRPWNAMSFVVGGQRYTALYMDHPDNPKPARYSERDYGRFGSYFVHDLLPGEPLVIRYRVWLQDGEMTVDEAKAMSEDFVNPPKVMVKSG